MLTCFNCGCALHTEDASLLWEEKVINGCPTILALLVVHQRCDDAIYGNSAGAWYGKGWHPDLHGADLFVGKKFALSSDADVLTELIEQRREEYARRARRSRTGGS